jgi:type IV pilus assembly protein PilB
MTFANGLRSILRQDPDIVMIGEIRDAETAQIAVRAAITGHLVLSTMHTNDTASTISRMVDMGIEPYLVSSSLVGVTAQRLMRRICPNCKTAYTPDRTEMEILRIREPVTIYKGAGCSTCNFTGTADVSPSTKS